MLNKLLVEFLGTMLFLYVIISVGNPLAIGLALTLVIILGGKISGAGGGGFFTFYCNKNHSKLREAMKERGLKELDYSFDYDGTKIISDNYQ